MLQVLLQSVANSHFYSLLSPANADYVLEGSTVGGNIPLSASGGYTVQIGIVDDFVLEGTEIIFFQFLFDTPEDMQIMVDLPGHLLITIQDNEGRSFEVCCGCLVCFVEVDILDLISVSSCNLSYCCLC